MEARLEIYRKILAVIYIFLIGFFALLCLQSGDDSGALSGNVSEMVAELFGLTKTEELARYLRKLIGHFGFFCFFGLISSLLYLTFIKLKVWIRIIISVSSGFIYIFITEFGFQMIAINRGPSMNDVLLDFSGFMIFSVITYAFYFIFRFIKLKKLYNNEKVRRIFFIIVGIAYGLLLITNIALSVINGNTSSKVSSSVSQVVIDTVPGTGNKTVSTSDNTTQQFLRKLIGHFGYFALLGAFSYLFYTNIKKIKIKWCHLINIIAGVGFAFISEYIFQAMVVSRSARFNDVIINSSGFLLMTIFMLFIISSIKLILKEDDSKIF